MRIAVWAFIGTLLTCWVAALNARLPTWMGGVDVPLLLVAYFAMRRGLGEAAWLAVALGYFVDTATTAPVGLHPFALVLTATWVTRMCDRLGFRDALHFGLVAGFAQASYHVTLVGLLWLHHRPIGFTSLAAALLVPYAAQSGLWGTLLYRPLVALDRRLVRHAPRGLLWPN